jgi:hypothetical protein
MRPLLYLLKRNLVNSVRELAKKPGVLIAYIIIAVFFALFLITSIVMPSRQLQAGSAEEFGAIVLMLILMIVYFGIRQGITSGSSFFRQADVNLVFTAPIAPQQVLVYGFIRQFFMTLMAALFVLFQIPNLRNNFAIGPAGVLVIIAGIILLFFSTQLFGMLVYSVASRSARTRSGLVSGLNIFVGLWLAGFMPVLLEKKDLLQAAVVYLNSRIFDCLPLVGWFKALLMVAVGGTGGAFLLNLALILAAIAVMVFILYALKTDYYEDVLVATDSREQAIRAKKEGRAGWNWNTRARKIKYRFTGTGAMAVLQRHLLEYRKTGWFFVDGSSLIVMAIGIASKYLFPFSSMTTTLYFSVYFLFFFSLQGKWSQELGRPFIYLIPASSAAKVFYATLAGVLKSGVDGLLLFAVAGFMFKSDIATVLLCALVYMTFGAVYTYGDVLARKLFGQTHSRNLALFVKMFLLLFIIAPGIIISVFSNSILGAAFNPELASYISFLALAAYNLIACALMLFMARSIFKELEMG